MKRANKISKAPFIKPAGGKKLEGRILRLLKKDMEPQRIFEKIKNSAEVNELGRFLYNFGLDRTLLKFSIKQLESKKPLPWPYLLKIFIKYKINPSEKMKKFFFYWLKREENQSPALFACKEWKSLSLEFHQLRSVYIQELEDRQVSEEKDLLEQLEFVRAQNLIKEEEDIVKRLTLINPSNKKYRKLFKDLEEKKALLVIQGQEGPARDSLRDSPLPLFQKPPKESWLKAIERASAMQPRQAKNLAIFLYFSGWTNKALEVLEGHISDMSDCWLYLDWALEAKQCAKGLELINRLFSEIKEGEEVFLPLIYIKSQMLHALGKKTEAIEHLSAICQVQPDYKSAQYLLDKWIKKS